MRFMAIPAFCAKPALSAAAALALVSTLPAAAQQRIGQAAAVENQVTRVSAGSSSALATGGSVFRAETIRTAAASKARLTFLDNTNLSVGPSSSVVLNQFVYAGGNAAQAVGVNLVRGAFRFSTGASDKSAYKINTPVATIGVRGTVLDIRSAGGTTDVTMVDNSEALVCSTAARTCATLSGAGSSVRVTNGGTQMLAPGQGYSFAANCTGGICGGGTQFAGLPPAQGGGDLLCGR